MPPERKMEPNSARSRSQSTAAAQVTRNALTYSLAATVAFAGFDLVHAQTPVEGDPQTAWQSAMDRGNSQTEAGKQQEAIEEFLKALSLSDKLEVSKKSAAQSALSQTYRELKDYVHSMQYAQDALATDSERQPPSQCAIAYDTADIATANALLGNLPQALKQAGDSAAMLESACSANNPTMTYGWQVQEAVLRALKRDAEADLLKKKISAVQNGYLVKVQRSIKAAWKPSPGASNKVRVFFHVLSDGSIKDLKIKESAGIKANEQSALNAVRDAAPFEKFSGDGPCDNVTIDFELAYNVKSIGPDSKDKDPAALRKLIASLQAEGAPPYIIDRKKYRLATLLADVGQYSQTLDIVNEIINRPLNNVDPDVRFKALLIKGQLLYQRNDMPGACVVLKELRESKNFIRLDSPSQKLILQLNSNALKTLGKVSEANILQARLKEIK